MCELLARLDEHTNHGRTTTSRVWFSYVRPELLGHGVDAGELLVVMARLGAHATTAFSRAASTINMYNVGERA